MEILSFLSKRLGRVNPVYKDLNENMDKLPTWYKLTAAVTTGAMLGAACAPKSGVPEQDTTNNSNSAKPVESTAIPEKVAPSALLTEITDKVEKDKIIAKLPKEHPEAENGDSGMDVFKIKAGNKTFNFVIYPLSNEAIQEKTGEMNPNATDAPQVAMYADYINYDGSSTMVRLVGEALVVMDGDKTTGDMVHKWYYDEKYQTENGIPVNKDRAVLGYTYPGEYNALFEPSSLMSPNIIIEGYVTDQVLAVTPSNNELPAALKVNAIIRKDAIEAKEFKLCTPKEWKQCEIQESDIPAYHEWAAKLPITVPAEVIDPQLMMYKDGNNGNVPFYIAPTLKGNQSVIGGQKDKSPYVKLSAAFVKTTDSQGRDSRTVLLPFRLIDPNNTSVNHTIMAAGSFPDWWHLYSDAEIDAVMNDFVNKMNVIPVMASSKDRFTEQIDPIVQKTFDNYNMPELLEKLANGDYSALDDPGIVVLTDITDSSFYR